MIPGVGLEQWRKRLLRTDSSHQPTSKLAGAIRGGCLVLKRTRLSVRNFVQTKAN